VVLQENTPRHAPEVPASRRGEQAASEFWAFRVFDAAYTLVVTPKLRVAAPAAIVKFWVPETKRRNSKPTPQFEHQSTEVEKSNPQGGVIFLFPLGTHQQALVSAKGDARAVKVRECSSRHIAR
jgi:hypothetical protein